VQAACRDFELPCVEIVGSPILEPTTFATDYVLGAATLYFAWKLWRVASDQGSRAVLLWAAAMLTFAISFIAGGSQHGFAAYLGAYSPIWRVTLLLTALATHLALWGTATAILNAVRRRAVAAASGLGVCAYCLFLFLVSDQFIYLLVYAVVPLILLLVISARSWLRQREPAGRWLCVGVVVTLLGGAAQASQIRLHEWFNHNDLFHVIQMGAMVLFFRGAALLHDFGPSEQA